MSSINFRLYGDQIYGFGNKYITEYISPEIAKEDFWVNLNPENYLMRIFPQKK